MNIAKVAWKSSFDFDLMQAYSVAWNWNTPSSLSFDSENSMEL